MLDALRRRRGPCVTATFDLVRQLVRIPSVNPSPEGEADVAEVLRNHLDASDLETRMLTSPGGRVSLVARIAGPRDRAPLVLLSHTDVVAVEEEAWQHDPFGGDVVDGELWGRGTLDMKGVAALHVAAVGALTTQAAEVRREVIVVATADEEAGGAEGARWLVDEHPELVGFRDGSPPPEVVSEGGFGVTGILDRPVMPIVLGEKWPLVVRARAGGDPGHASLPPDDQAIRSLIRFVDAVCGPRRARVHPLMRGMFAALAGSADGARGRLFRVLAGPHGDATARVLAPLLRARMGTIGHLLSDTVTPTRLEAGYAINVVPGRAEASFDCRLLPDTDPERFLAWLTRVARRHDVTIEELHRWPSAASTAGPLMDLLVTLSAELPSRPIAAPSLTPALTDLRWFRARGATGYGWVPLVLSQELLATVHGHDERVPVDELDRATSAVSELVVRACTDATDPR